MESSASWTAMDSKACFWTAKMGGNELRNRVLHGDSPSLDAPFGHTGSSNTSPSSVFFRRYRKKLSTSTALRGHAVLKPSIHLVALSSVAVRQLYDTQLHRFCSEVCYPVIVRVFGLRDG